MAEVQITQGAVICRRAQRENQEKHYKLCLKLDFASFADFSMLFFSVFSVRSMVKFFIN
jgi:hypothetical protein